MLGCGEAVDIDSLGDEHGGGGHADTGDGHHVEVRGRRQSRVGFPEQLAHLVLGVLRVTHLRDQVAHERFGHVAS